VITDLVGGVVVQSLGLPPLARRLFAVSILSLLVMKCWSAWTVLWGRVQVVRAKRNVWQTNAPAGCSTFHWTRLD